MAYVEIRRNGKVVRRSLVEEQKARKGCRIRVGSAGQVHLQVGQTKTIGKYEISMLEGTPEQVHDAAGRSRTESDAFPSVSQTEQAEFTGAFQAKPGGGKSPLPKIEGYEITSRLGQGGMGTVWRAIELSTKREVALKFLGRHRFDSKKSRARFEREVSLAAKLTHPNIARVYHSDLYRGVYYYAMELVDGLHLDKYVQQHELSQREILELMRNVCDAVQHAHQRGIIHRDLKPSNILVTKDGQPHVVDFGLAKASVKENDDITISIEGEVTGTLAYMSPEQAAGRINKIGEQTDVYSLGVILYQLLTGRLPHDVSGSRYDVVKRIVEDEVENPRDYDGHIDSDLESLLLTALAKEPEERYPSAAVLLQDIRNYLNGEPLYARSLSATYRIRKRVRKHAKPIAGAFLFLIIIGAIATVSFCLVSSERKKRIEAEKLVGMQVESITAGSEQTKQSEMPNSSRQDMPQADNGSQGDISNGQPGQTPRQQTYTGENVNQSETTDEYSVVYVDKNSKGLNNGSSWNNAFNTIQPAIDAASAKGGGEIWIAAGIYNEARNHIFGSLVMRPKVKIYGGFSGTETQRDQQNRTANVTIIDGSIARAGAAATHVIIGSDDTVLDGFTVKGGRAGSAGGWQDNHGGGLFNDHCSPIIRNCRFINNWSPASDPGGGSAIYNHFSSPLIENCYFEGNEGRHGGAIFNREQSHATIRNCIFINNKGNQASGAIHITDHSNPVIENCLFYRNSAGVNGGASFSHWDSSPTYINCVFRENHANREGGAVVCESGNQVIKHCTFYGNTSASGEGTIDIGSDGAGIFNSIIWNCNGGTINIKSRKNVIINTCIIQGGLNTGTNITIENPRFVNPNNGDFHLMRNSPCIDKGDNAYAVTADYDDIPRPLDGNADGSAVVDIGAFEFVPSTESDPALKEKWLKALRPSIEVISDIGDMESRALINEIILSLEQTNGASSLALAGYFQRMKEATRSLVRRGKLESGSEMNWALWQACYQAGPGIDGPLSNARNQSIGRPGADGLVLYLPFDEESSDGTLRDESGAANHGHVAGAKWVAAGRVGGAYQFGITNLTDCILIPDSDTLDVGQVTVAAWIKTSDNDGFWNRILDKDWRKGYCLSIGGDWNGKAARGKLVFEVNNRGIKSDSPIGDDQWHHVAGTFDGKTQRLYVDGMEQKEKNNRHTGPIPKNNWDLYIGNSRIDYGTGEFLAFDGLIDEIMVYNRALSAQEIRDMYLRIDKKQSSQSSQ